MKIGLFGAGHLGRIHAKCIGLIPELELVGFYDPSEEVSDQVSSSFGISAFDTPAELLDECELVDVVSPTVTHFEVASEAISAGKHVFIEKPVTHTIAEAKELIRLKNQHRVRVQVGHVERFNPAFLALRDLDLDPKFIEGHRLAAFNPRGTDVSVVLDLMIHDLDLILKIVEDEVTDIQAKGVSILSTTDDICNARISFARGCVVNLTASRISMKQMRKLRLFQSDAYISMDFLEKESQIIRLFDATEDDDDNNILETARGRKRIEIRTPPAPPVNAIQMELESFYHCIQQDQKPYVSLEDGYKALMLAYEIMDCCRKS